MIRAKLSAVIRVLTRIVTQPLSELNRWQKAARFAYDLVRYSAHRLDRDRAHQMAAALSFRTLFGLLPVLVVAMVLVRAMDMDRWFLEPLARLLTFAGLHEVTIVPPSGIEGTAQTLDLWMLDRVQEAGQINLAAVGWVGMGVMTYAAIGLLVTIEDCFNAIYRAPRGRPWTRRVPLYWFLLTSSPLAVILSNSLNNYVQPWIRAMQSFQWASAVVAIGWSILVLWLFMTVVYLLFPNTTVRWGPAVFGALVAAVLLELGKHTLGVFLSRGLALSHLYGSLGLVPLFMFWVYLMWLVVLLGLEVSATAQLLGGRQLHELRGDEQRPLLVAPTAVVEAMQAIANRFGEGKTTELAILAARLDLPDEVLDQVFTRLESGGWLHQLDSKRKEVTLARPPDQIPLVELLEVGFDLARRGEGVARDGAAALFRQAQLDAAGTRSLADLASRPPESSRPPDQPSRPEPSDQAEAGLR